MKFERKLLMLSLLIFVFGCVDHLSIKTSLEVQAVKIIDNREVKILGDIELADWSPDLKRSYWFSKFGGTLHMLDHESFNFEPIILDSNAVQFQDMFLSFSIRDSLLFFVTTSGYGFYDLRDRAFISYTKTLMAQHKPGSADIDWLSDSVVVSNFSPYDQILPGDSLPYLTQYFLSGEIIRIRTLINNQVDRDARTFNYFQYIEDMGISVQYSTPLNVLGLFSEPFLVPSISFADIEVFGIEPSDEPIGIEDLPFVNDVYSVVNIENKIFIHSYISKSEPNVPLSDTKYESYCTVLDLATFNSEVYFLNDLYVIHGKLDNNKYLASPMDDETPTGKIFTIIELNN